MRLEAFLARKKGDTVSSKSSLESESGGHSLEGPGKPPNQTAPGDKVRSRMEINPPTTSINKLDSKKGSFSHKKMGVKEVKRSIQECLADVRRLSEQNWDPMRRNEQESERRHQAIKEHTRMTQKHTEMVLSKFK